MKRSIALILVFLVAVGLVLSGCGKPKTTQITIATGGTAGTYYPLGGAMAQVFNNKVANVNATAQSTGASVENMRLIGKKEVELSFVQNDIAHYAFNGQEAFKEKIGNIAAIATLYPEIVQIVVPADSAVQAVADLKGLKVSVGAAGSGTEANARQILAAAGLTYDDVEEQFLSFAESADQFKDKLVDAIFITSGVPNAAVQDMSTSRAVRVLPIADDIIAKLTADYPFFSKFEIPANSYKDQAAPVVTVAVQAILVAEKDLDADLVYELTKAIYENKEELVTVNAKAKNINLEKPLTGVTVPVHAGAEKFYKEKGVK